LSPQPKHLFVGVDIHKKTHCAVIVDIFGKKLSEIQFKNTPTAYPELIAEVKKHQKKGYSPIYGLEDIGSWGRGLAVYLSEQRKTVKEVHPKLSSDRRKTRHIVQKSDSWDAECIAKVLRDEYERLPDIKPVDLYWTINQLFNARRSMLKQVAVTVNRLHNTLHTHYPSYRSFFAEVDNTTALAFWGKYPCPSELNGVSVETLAEFVIEHSNRKYTAEKAIFILEAVRADGVRDTEFQEQRNHMVRTMARTLRFYQIEIKGIEKELKALVMSLEMQLETMPGMEFLSACAFISEIGDINRFPTADKLSMYAGIAPIIKGTGGKHEMKKNPYGNRELHVLFQKLAIKQVTKPKGKSEPINPHLAAYFESKMKQGKTRKQAYVCVMRKLVNVVFSLMKSKNTYVMPKVVDFT
jgi:transposase